jgi:hypothetical protein
MDPEYIELVKKWVQLDNTILRNNVQVKTAKDEVKRIETQVDTVLEEKKIIEKQILDYVQTEKLDAMQLKISDGVITFGKRTTQKPINQRFLKDTLQKYAEENPSEEIDHMKLFDYIISNQEKKVEFVINRTVKDKQ